MDKNRLVMIGVLLAIVVVAGLGYVLGVQPQLTAASAADAQRTSIAADNQVKELAIVKLKSDYAKLAGLKQQLLGLQQSVPQSEDLDAFLRNLHDLAAATHTTISSFAPGDAVAYIPPAAPAAPAAPPSASTSTPSATPTPAPSVAPAPAKAVAPLLPTNPLITGQNFVAIPVKVGVQADSATSLVFLNGLQNGRRLFLVTGFNGGAATGVSGASTPTTSEYTISGFVYVLVSAPEAVTATGSGAASGQTPAPSPTPTK